MSTEQMSRYRTKEARAKHVEEQRRYQQRHPNRVAETQRKYREGNQECDARNETHQETVGRFWSKVYKTPGCWFWLGTHSHGYAKFSMKGVMRPAHRVAWELAHNQPFPEGKITLHSCDTKNCVRPDHLSPGTDRDNSWDGRDKGRVGSFPTEHCRRGHPWREETTLYYRKRHKGGILARRCGICAKARVELRAAQQKAPGEGT
jgi:hypothetical protein